MGTAEPICLRLPKEKKVFSEAYSPPEEKMRKNCVFSVNNCSPKFVIIFHVFHKVELLHRNFESRTNLFLTAYHTFSKRLFCALSPNGLRVDCVTETLKEPCVRPRVQATKPGFLACLCLKTLLCATNVDVYNCAQSTQICHKERHPFSLYWRTRDPDTSTSQNNIMNGIASQHSGIVNITIFTAIIH